MKTMIQQFLHDEDGVAAIEYGLLAGLIAVTIIAGATVVGTSLSTLFTNISTKLSALATTAA